MAIDPTTGLIATAQTPVVTSPTAVTPLTGTGTVAAPTQANANGQQTAPQNITQATAYTAAPAAWQNSSDQTTAGQLANLTKTDNPIMTQAQTTALQGMNGRGLLNSSIAQQAGQAAWYQAAAPIASADATQASKVAGYNTDQVNQAQTTAAQTQTQVSGQNAQSQNAVLVQNMDTNTKMNLANIEASYKNVMQSSASAQALYSQAVKNISDIQGSTTMDAAAKTAAIANQTKMLKSGMDIQSSISGLDLSGILDFSQVT